MGVPRMLSKSRKGVRISLILGLCAAAMLLPAAAQARVFIGFGLPFPPVFAPPPVYYGPPPVYYGPPPGYAPPGYGPPGYGPPGYGPPGYAPPGYAPPGYAPSQGSVPPSEAGPPSSYGAGPPGYDDGSYADDGN